MASARGGLKDFYKQRKTNGISKAKNKASKPSSRKTKSPANAATLGSDGVQSAAVISHGSLDLLGSSLFFSSLLCFFGFLEFFVVLVRFLETLVSVSFSSYNNVLWMTCGLIPRDSVALSMFQCRSCWILVSKFYNSRIEDSRFWIIFKCYWSNMLRLMRRDYEGLSTFSKKLLDTGWNLVL